MNVTMKQTCGGCPLQYEGTVGDEFWYFRYRWEQWQFGVGKTAAGSSNGAVGVSQGFVEGYRQTGEADYMEPEEAERLITNLVVGYMEQ